MKKILLSMAFASVIASASPYGGIKIGGSFLNVKSKLNGSAYIVQNAGALGDFTFDMGSKNNCFVFGLLGGYTFKVREKLNILTEIDFEYGAGTSKKQNFNPGGGALIGLNNENFTIKSKFAFGFMPAIGYDFSEKVSGLFGVRLSMTQYEVNAFHTAVNGTTLPLNNKTAKAFVFGVEPTVGVQVKLTDKISGRFTAGYVISQKKKVIDNYVGSPWFVNNNYKAGVEIQPSGVRLMVAGIYSF